MRIDMTIDVTCMLVLHNDVCMCHVEHLWCTCGTCDGERDPSPPLRETLMTRVQRIVPFFNFRISFSKSFGPFCV